MNLPSLFIFTGTGLCHHGELDVTRMGYIDTRIHFTNGGIYRGNDKRKPDFRSYYPAGGCN